MGSAIRVTAIPLLPLVEHASWVKRVRVCGDNQAMVSVMKTGRSPTMRRLTRPYLVSIAWPHEQHQREHFVFTYVRSGEIVADTPTKAIPNPDG